VHEQPPGRLEQWFERVELKRRSRTDSKIEFDQLFEGRGAARSRGRYKSEANELFQDIQTDRSCF
jgi:hypothetical protein